MSNLEIDDKRILAEFGELTSKDQYKSYKKSIKKSANIIVRAARRRLKQRIGPAINHKNRWNGRTLASGIRASIGRDKVTASVHIMGDFRLKFFELGTSERYTKASGRKYSRGRRGKGSYRGKMKPLYFFRSAVKSKESEVESSFFTSLEASIEKIKEKYR